MRVIFTQHLVRGIKIIITSAARRPNTEKTVSLFSLSDSRETYPRIGIIFAIHT